MAGNLVQVSEETGGICGFILQEKIHRKRAIPSMSNDVVRRVLRQAQKI